VHSRTENSGGQFWKRLRLTEDCNARRRKTHSDVRLPRMAVYSSCGAHIQPTVFPSRVSLTGPSL